ncbi:hypothetical protein T310_0819 [Rasamsonia emersonii CBS 393.64]|uniref:Mannosyltransferase n=1 Tax=Rasamsonia emersonii (strain ATCC 16479 / CBS 393.64 / IMI 116815) TaxID=1408163 RepID=A0A0F4Z3K8_RASE3|nr:hypothetical protein T310_0819 [Rasamsonia emersonii CBS 393.64]KKA25114.1 hypothetical protein T310_0819 [Rasamsonia emersonii CBS 393.64]
MSTASSDLALSSPEASSHVSSTSIRRGRRSPAAPTNILLFLVAFRVLNALCVRTFFQPDEFFQSLEPAWQIAFGKDSGAWITWEWKHQLRSSIHPVFFAAVYYVAGSIAWLLRHSPLTAADLLIAAPKTTQAVIAAIGDYYTWKLAGRVYGPDSHGAWATLALTVLSPWQWFCSTRTLSNCLETTLTVVAVYHWPWEWFLGIEEDNDDGGAYKDASQAPSGHGTGSRLASAGLHPAPNKRPDLDVPGKLCSAQSSQANTLDPSEGSCRMRSLAVFYGRNDWHYYLSQGLPLLLTTALPFTILGVYRALRSNSTFSAPGDRQLLIKRQLAFVCLFMPFVLSLIAHKEVRFIYPLLPALHVLTSEPLVSFFLPAVLNSSGAYVPRRLILLFLLLVNIFVAYYTTVSHASGPLSVLSYLRERHQAHHEPSHLLQPPFPSLGSSAPNRVASGDSPKDMTVGFLMPCHSTPWRSHLVFPSIHAWALSCEPPVGFNESQKAAYLDEADQFYANPSDFLRHNMIGGLRHIPRRPSYLSSIRSQSVHGTQRDDSVQHGWPDYLVFFAQLEPTLNSLLRTSSYAECWRTWNTAWHDDWRRRGDIVVWCLDPVEQQNWRNLQRKRAIERRDRQFDRIIKEIKKEAAARGLWGRKQASSWWPFAPSSSLSWPWAKSRKSYRILSDFHLPSSWPFSKKTKKESSKISLYPY